MCECQMKSCYDYNNVTNRCIIKKCRTLYLESNRIICMNHGAKSKTQALLLNIFAFTGAANFYLKHYALAVGQVLFFIVFLITVCCRFYTCNRLLCTDSDIVCRCVKKALAFGITDCLASFFIILELIWIFYDFYQIGTNGKLDGDGCILADDVIQTAEDIPGVILDVLPEVAAE